MQIFVVDDQTRAVEVQPEDTVGELLDILECGGGGRMLYAGEQLDEEATLGDYGIEEEATVQIVHRVVGGGRKRKKKVYTTPKKIKHKRKKVKLATLKYYKVTDTGKLERKRKECPAPSCGAGIFMSNHKDRQYCGKCGLTMKFEEK